MENKHKELVVHESLIFHIMTSSIAFFFFKCAYLQGWISCSIHYLISLDLNFIVRPPVKRGYLQTSCYLCNKVLPKIIASVLYYLSRLWPQEYCTCEGDCDQYQIYTFRKYKQYLVETLLWQHCKRFMGPLIWIKWKKRSLSEIQISFYCLGLYLR